MNTYSAVENLLSVIMNGQIYTTDLSENINFKEIGDKLKKNEYDDELLELMSNGDTSLKAQEKLKDSIFEENGDNITYDGKVLPQGLQEMVRSNMEAGVSVVHIERFVQRLFTNVSMSARNEVFKFLQNKHLPITPDGKFIGYKSVNDNMKDWHTGTVDNSPGAIIPRFKRADVDDNANVGCSHGYHVGSYAYASSFHGGRNILACLVDPADVVCVPNADYGKVRITYYEPVKLIKGVMDESPVYSNKVEPVGGFNPAGDWYTIYDPEDEDDEEGNWSRCDEGECDAEDVKENLPEITTEKLEKQFDEIFANFISSLLAS